MRNKIFFRKVNGGQNCGRFTPTTQGPEDFFGTQNLIRFCETNHPTLFTARVGYQAYIRFEDLPKEYINQIRTVAKNEHYHHARVDNGTTWEQLLLILDNNR